MVGEVEGSYEPHEERYELIEGRTMRLVMSIDVMMVPCRTHARNVDGLRSNDYRNLNQSSTSDVLLRVICDSDNHIRNVKLVHDLTPLWSDWAPTDWAPNATDVPLKRNGFRIMSSLVVCSLSKDMGR